VATNATSAGGHSCWHILEESFDPTWVNAYETLFTTGNGYLAVVCHLYGGR
jgi:trehalose/maltose hydrolase-like predicted phosphorylase